MTPARVVPLAPRTRAPNPRVQGSWKLPGGLLDLGEELRDGVVREVREETGVEATFRSLLAMRRAISYAHTLHHKLHQIVRCLQRFDLFPMWEHRSHRLQKFTFKILFHFTNSFCQLLIGACRRQ